MGLAATTLNKEPNRTQYVLAKLSQVVDD